MRKTKGAQIDFFSKRSKSYGGILLNQRKNRAYARPISTSQSMHLVLRSSKAVGHQSFKTSQNQKYIQKTIQMFSLKYGVHIISLANVGNHLHLHVKIAKRTGYLCFIRAVTAAIAMYVSGRNRWTQKLRDKSGFRGKKEKFWDYRPFTRIVEGFRAFLSMQDYTEINQLESLGVPRMNARMMLVNSRPKLC